MSRPRIAALTAILCLGVWACGGEPAATTAGEAAPVAPAPTTTEVGVTTTVAEPPTTTVTTLPTTTTTASAAAEFVTLLDTGAVAAAVVSPQGGVSGEILDVSLASQSDDDLRFVLPCGFVFVPDDGAEQRMMTVQPVDVTLPPGQSQVVTPYVMCIDADRPAPDSGSTYMAGEMAEDELLQLAQCVCTRDLAEELDPLMGDMSLQMAVWAASEGEEPDLAGALDDVEGALGEGALGDLLGEGMGVDLEELTGVEGFDVEAMLEQAMQFMEQSGVSASTWLDECGIELGK